MTAKPDGIAYPPRGLGRDEAARYIGVSPTKFDKLVSERRMPKPLRIDGRVVWDRAKLDAAFSELEEPPQSEIDRLLAESRRQ